MSDSAPRFLLGLTALLCFLPGSAASQVEFYQEGNRLYQEGDFQAALSSYQRVIETGLESGEIYYNVGNSYFKLGDLARAILNYERARRLLPGDEDVRANLDLARSLTADEIEPRQRFWVLDAWSASLGRLCGCWRWRHHRLDFCHHLSLDCRFSWIV